MNAAEEVMKKLSLPPISQIGVIVKDMKKAVNYYSSIFGIGPFSVFELKPERFWIMEKPANHTNLRLLVGKGMWGNIEFELIQPFEERSLWKEFLDTHGEGMHHLAFNVPNFDEWFEKLKGEGFQPMIISESYLPNIKGNVKSCYFDTRRVGGIIFEIRYLGNRG